MARDHKGLRAVISEVARGGDRSSLFWWLVDHHDDLVEAARGRRIQWGPLARKFAELGLTDRTGKPASAKAARLTWHRARRVVAEDRARRESDHGRKRLMPSRLSQDWRPDVVVPPPPAFSPPGPAPAARSHYPARVMLDQGEETPMSPEAQAELDRASAMLKAYDADRFRFGGG